MAYVTKSLDELIDELGSAIRDTRLDARDKDGDGMDNRDEVDEAERLLAELTAWADAFSLKAVEVRYNKP